MYIIHHTRLGVKLILTTDFTDPFDKLRTSFYRFSQILWIELPAKETEDTEIRSRRIGHGLILTGFLTGNGLDS
jgi:hypothetical protein